MVVDEADLNGFGVRGPVLRISQHRLLGQDIYLVSHSAHTIFRDFVDGRHLRIGVKSMRIFITVLFVASLSLFWGCASVPAGAGTSGSGLSFYTFEDSGTGLIRAFEHENTTVLQFANLEGERFVILDGKGHQLKYERVGEHYVVLAGTYGSLTVRMFTRNASVNITGSSGKTVEKREIAATKAPILPPEPKTSTPIAEPVQAKVAISAPVSTPKVEVAPACSSKTEALDSKSISPGLTGYVVQVETCTDRPSAEKLKEKLASYGYDAEIKERSHPKRGIVYGVRLRPVGLVEAYDCMKRLRHDLGVRPKLMEIPPDELAAYEAGK